MHSRHTSVTYRVAVRALVAAGAVLAAVSLAATAGGSGSAPASLRLDGVPFRPELALTSAQQQRGLMFRKRAPQDGMLFVFPRATTGGFWMKNTLVPLTIVFFDTAGKSVRRLTMTPCRKDPCRDLRPGAPVPLRTRAPCERRAAGKAPRPAERAQATAPARRLIDPCAASSLSVSPRRPCFSSSQEAKRSSGSSSSSIPATTCARTRRRSRSGPARRCARSRTAAARAES